jgi:acetyl esterase
MQTPRASQRLFAEGFLLTLRDRDAFFHHYTHGTSACVDDSRVSPMRTADLSNAPPALIAIAGFDILRDEGEAYASALESAGVPVRVLRHPGLEHGFIHLTGVCPTARRAMLAIASEWGELLQGRVPVTTPAEGDR